MYVARYSAHIKEDIFRNWSSWNFGKEGFCGTREELDNYLASATDDEPVDISGFEIYAEQIRQFKFGELYPNYWVAIDDRGGLSCDILNSASLEDAIAEANIVANGSGDGSFVDCSDAKVVYSESSEGFCLHILEVE